MIPVPPLDALLNAADNALRTLFSPHAAARPAPRLSPPPALSPDETRHAAGLMRVNHAGEIAAQALYHGQALFARDPPTRALLERAAGDEGDHLAWCEQRLAELHSHTTRLAPLWYAGSFAIGAAAALAGDRWSLGFVRETERQVEGHLASHLERLPANDARSRDIVRQMQADEVRHGQAAADAGGADLPVPLPQLMRATARVMTASAYWC